MTTVTGRFTQLEPRHRFIAPRPNTAQERRQAALTCARASLAQPDPAGDLAVLLAALGLDGDEQ